jgi:hypothetical protein
MLGPISLGTVGMMVGIGSVVGTVVSGGVVASGSVFLLQAAKLNARIRAKLKMAILFIRNLLI